MDMDVTQGVQKKGSDYLSLIEIISFVRYNTKAF